MRSSYLEYTSLTAERALSVFSFTSIAFFLATSLAFLVAVFAAEVAEDAAIVETRAPAATPRRCWTGVPSGSEAPWPIRVPAVAAMG